MTSKQSKDCLKKMEEVAYLAGKVLLKYQKKVSSLKVNLKDAQGCVSEADLASEKLIINKLKKAYPNFEFLAEESSYKAKDKHFEEYSKKEWCWIIDPLDGTNNFLNAFDYYAVCIALVHYGEPVIGLVYRPNTGELFTAIQGKGAYKGTIGKRKKIKRSDHKNKLSQCLLVTGFISEKIEKLFPVEFEQFKDLMVATRGVRRMGSAALDLCYVATGVWDGFWERGLAPWDVAASGIICLEAGIKVTDYNNHPFNPFHKSIISTPKKIHSQLLKHFK
jgi:myo-inositol-1(or 4)-monophosphatase